MSVNGIGGTRGIDGFDVAHSTSAAAGAKPAEGQVVRGSTGPARPDPARAATDRALRSLDAGLATYNLYQASGGTAKAVSTVKVVDKETKVSFWNMRIDQGEKQKAFDAMKGLSNKEFFYCLQRTGWTIQDGGWDRGGWSQARFLFEPKFKAETDRRLRAIEQEMTAACRGDAVASSFCVDTLRAQVANVFSK